MRGVIRAIFADHLGTVASGRELSEREWRGAWCIATCRTQAQGMHVRECPEAHSAHEFFNSCRHRGCPQCGWAATQRWIERRAEQVPACAHVHTIWTVPHAFGPLWAYNRAAFTRLMFAASWETVQTLMADARWCGARPGMVAVFQSWGDHLQQHPHIHALVTAGGVAADGTWRDAQHSFVLCARAAMALYRGKMRGAILEALAAGRLVCPPGTDAAGWAREADRQGLRKWNMRVQPPYTDTARVIRYVGAYLRRGPLSERRVLSYDGQTVRIEHRHPENHAAAEFVLSGPECVRRLLLHMPEPRLHTSRLYGIYHPAARDELAAARAHFDQAPVPTPPHESDAATYARRFPAAPPAVCPVCGSPLRVRVVIHGGQSPPWRFRSEQRRRAA